MWEGLWLSWGRHLLRKTCPCCVILFYRGVIEMSCSSQGCTVLYGLSILTQPRPTTAMCQRNSCHSERYYCQVLPLCLFCFLTRQLRMAPAPGFTVRTDCGEISPALRFLSGLGQLQFHGCPRTEKKQDQRATAESKDPDFILTERCDPKQGMAWSVYTT